MGEMSHTRKTNDIMINRISVIPREGHTAQIILRDPFTDVQVRVGVMGSAGGDYDISILENCRKVGRTIAERGCCLLTGACPGLPHEAVLGAKECNGHTVGISPAMSLKEHINRYDSPYKEYDVLIFTGMGLMGRELVNIRSSDIIIVVGGRSGTLGEFAIAYEEGKLIGVLSGSGGITQVMPTIETGLGKSTGAMVLYDSDPQLLIEQLLDQYLLALSPIAIPMVGIDPRQ